MSTITQTNFGQLNFRAAVVSVGFECLGHGKCVLKCNIKDGKGWRFTKNDLIHPSTYAQLLKMAWDVKNWDW